MTLSATDLTALTQLLVAHEGLRLRPYSDTVGKLTIGVGRNLTDKGISEAEAYYLLDDDIADVDIGLNLALPWTTALDAVRLRVLLDIGFNAGIEGLLRFHKMLAALERGDHETAAQEILNSALAPHRKQRLADLMRS